ncbi:MAG: hypothetical protein ACD_83C00043G0001, partial [uncultured bacterium]
DYDMWLKIAAEFPISRCNQVVIKRRVHAAMGTIQLTMQVKLDTKLAVKEAFNRLTIQEIFPDRLTNKSSKQKMAKCYVELGDLLAVKWRWLDLALDQYCKGLDEYPDSQELQLRVKLGPWLYHLPKLVRWELRERYWKFRKSVYRI